MLDKRWRATVERGLQPVGESLHRARVNPDALTVLGLAFSVATALLIATGRPGLAVAGIVLTGVPDILDGTVARHSGRAGPRGAFLDSVVDRVSDAVLLGGVAWFLASESPYLPVLAFAALALSMLISYERAKGEGLGFSAKGGILERAERLVLLAFGLAFDVLVPVLWVMVVLGAVTAVHRFGKVLLQATGPADQPGPVAGDSPQPDAAPAAVVPTPPRRVRHPRRRGGETLEPAGAPRSGRLAEWWAARRPSRGERARPRRPRRDRP
jgi:CDP-diacylglycerol---glycerol-3-phosphate 3-phosphatidyltransferase